jgi:hypothetical protein
MSQATIDEQTSIHTRRIGAWSRNKSNTQLDDRERSADGSSAAAGGSQVDSCRHAGCAEAHAILHVSPSFSHRHRARHSTHSDSATDPLTQIFIPGCYEC